MKKRIAAMVVAFVLALTMCALGAQAQTVNKSITFQWDDATASTDGVTAWRMFYSTSATGTKTALPDLAIGTPDSSGNYSGTWTFPVPTGANTTLSFVLEAVNGSGVTSADSNQVSQNYNLTTPQAPTNFRIKGLVSIPTEKKPPEKAKK